MSEFVEIPVCLPVWGRAESENSYCTSDACLNLSFHCSLVVYLLSRMWIVDGYWRSKEAFLYFTWRMCVITVRREWLSASTLSTLLSTNESRTAVNILTGHETVFYIKYMCILLIVKYIDENSAARPQCHVCLVCVCVAVKCRRGWCFPVICSVFSCVCWPRAHNTEAQRGLRKITIRWYTHTHICVSGVSVRGWWEGCVCPCLLWGPKPECT